MEPQPNTAAQAPARRVKKRVLIPGIILAILIVLAVWIFIRGTWADAVEKNPQSSAEGAIAQLYQSPDGHKHIRCALVVDYPVEKVWAVITDYDHFSEFFPYLRSLQAAKEPDGRYHLTGVVGAPLFGNWTFDTVVRHEESPTQRRVVWDQPGGELLVNRGNWTLTPKGEGKTLIIYTLEVEVKHSPAFFVRAVLLDHVKAIVTAVDTRLKATANTKS